MCNTASIMFEICWYMTGVYCMFIPVSIAYILLFIVIVSLNFIPTYIPNIMGWFEEIRG